MNSKDIVVFLLYILGNIGVSVYLGKKIKNSGDFFAAGNQSSWWLSGLSAFMTMFSSGTFVVWGGIAFQQGMVAVTIAMCLGISALLVGYGLASKWRKLGVSSAAEYINKRYGEFALNFYTWFTVLYRLLGMAVALYSLAVILEALFPQELRLWLTISLGMDPVAGLIVFCGIVIVLYAIFGGLWAVLLTDVLQFVILMIAVIMVIPLGFIKMGGVDHFINNVPEGFFSLTSPEFGWLFMVGWVVIHYFKIGGEWAFVQRFVCVTSPKEANKASLLFGAMYLVSPIIWMLPPMMYRVIDPSANYEQAYILACQYALPDGLLGLMIASMFAATVSMVDSELNVYAGVLTRDFYKQLFPQASEKKQVWVGRWFTLLLGALVVALAIQVPNMGGAKDIILSITALVAGITVLPVIWGLFSVRISEKLALWVIAGSSVLLLIIKFGFLSTTSWFVSDSAFSLLLVKQARTIEVIAGILVPLVLLLLVEVCATKKEKVVFVELDEEEQIANVSLFPAKIITVSIAGIGVVISILATIATEQVLVQWLLAAFLYALAGVFALAIRRKERRMQNDEGIKVESECEVIR